MYSIVCLSPLINSSKKTTKRPVDGFVSVSSARAPIAIGRKQESHASLMLIGWARLLSSRFSAFSVPFLSKTGFSVPFLSKNRLFVELALLTQWLTSDQYEQFSVTFHFYKVGPRA